MRFNLAMAVVLAALSASPARAASPVEAGKVFSGPEGEEVALVPLAPRESKKFLLRVQGTGSELDGMVLPYELNDWSSSGTVRQNYSTEWHGRGYSTLVVQNTTYELYVPGRSNAIRVKYDEARTQKLKAEDVFAQHQKQQKDGTLAKLMAFDRKAEQARHDGAYAEQLKALNASCGTAVAGSIDWSSVSEELLKEYSISGFCETPLTSLRALCDVSNEAKRTVQARVKQVDCRFGPNLEPRLQAERVVWTTAKDVANQDEFATRFFKKNLAVAAGLASGASQAVEPPWGKEENLGQRMLLEATSVCTDGKGHYVVVAPQEETNNVQLYYGDVKQFVEVAPPQGLISATSFLDPRFVNKGANPNFRGMDMRVYSHVELDAKQKTCSLRCGEREVALTVLEGEQARELLRKASYAPNPQKYVPHALLRDSRGNYYFVDRGFLPEESKNFRVFIGPRGDLKQQKMTNVVSDSEGEIFSTRKGELRLVLDRQLTPQWIENTKKSVELRVVPVHENLPLIYNELGVYTGARLGTPCDDQ